jgi:phosphatidylglycerophosphatase A
MRRLILFAAQGCGIGRIPVAPGTFGSLLGLLWFAALLWTGELWLWVLGVLAGIFGAVWICGEAEKLLGLRDPGSVVLDEVVAVPACFAAWIFLMTFQTGELPAPQVLLQPRSLIITAGIFAGFRFFDVLKPWPVRQSQELPAGWGVVMDDILAAVYVNLLFLIAWWFTGQATQGRP